MRWKENERARQVAITFCMNIFEHAEAIFLWFIVHLFMVSICLCTSANVFHVFFISCCSPIKTTHIKCFVMFLRFPSVNMKSASGKRQGILTQPLCTYIYCGSKSVQMSVLGWVCVVKSVTFIFHKIVFYCVWFSVARCRLIGHFFFSLWLIHHSTFRWYIRRCWRKKRYYEFQHTNSIRICLCSLARGLIDARVECMRCAWKRMHVVAFFFFLSSSNSIPSYF